MKSLSTLNKLRARFKVSLMDGSGFLKQCHFGKLIIVFTLVACFWVIPVAAQNKNAESIANQVNRMQRDLQVLSRQVFKRGVIGHSSQTAASMRESSSNAYIIRVEDRLDQLEGETRSNTGNIENITHTLKQISARLESLGNDMNFRLTSIEQRLNILTRNPQVRQQSALSATGQISQLPATPRLTKVPRAEGVQQIGPTTGGTALAGRQRALGTITQQELNTVRRQDSSTALQPINQGFPSATLGAGVLQQPTIPKKVLPPGTPKEQYKFAFGLVRKQDFREAIEALEEFIKTYPSEPLTSNARNWLGRTHYVRKDYQRAAEVFLAAYQFQPKGHKAADNLFRLGISLAGMEKKSDACATFDKLEQDFPDRKPIIEKQLVQQRKKIGCG